MMLTARSRSSRASAPEPSAEPGPGSGVSKAIPLLRPGESCWVTRHAYRAAVLIDADEYFHAFAEAASRARESILVVGWDFNSQIRLHHPPSEAAGCDALGPFLNSCAARRRGLRIHVLDWDFAMLYALERELLPRLRFGARAHRRVHFELDDAHPLGASQHQKIVVIDDAIAFVGGFDFGMSRWDTSDHLAVDPRRRNAWGRSYPPFHDVQMAVDGAAAEALGDLVRERWRRATGRRLRRPRAGSDPWPADLVPDLRDVQVGIARTQPAFGGEAAIAEVERLYLDSIAAARRFVYVENQYFTSARICEALAARLEEPDGPEVVLVLPLQCSGWLEQKTMGAMRADILRRLRAADRHGRLGLYHPVIPGEDAPPVNVHSKVFVVDDDFLRVGSSNLANRSMGFDSECDLAIASAGSARVQERIAHVRARLLGEHLGIEPRAFGAAVRERGSLLGAVEALRGGERTLAEIGVEDDGCGEESFALALSRPLVVDPERPIAAEEMVTLLMPEEIRDGAHRPLVRVGVVLGAFLAAGALWRWTPLAEWLHPERLAGAIEGLAGEPIGFALVLGVYAIGSLVLVPVTALNVAVALAFDPLLAFASAFGGSIVGAIASYAAGRALGRDTIRRLAGRHLDGVRRFFRNPARGVSAVAVLRLLPVAPFTIVNLAAGAAAVPFRHYVAGTALGMAPGILAMTLLAEQIEAAIADPRPLRLLALGGVAAALVGAGVWVRRRLGALRGAAPRDAGATAGAAAARRARTIDLGLAG